MNIIILIVAAIACFFGYKLNKTLIAILGFLIGYKLGLAYIPNFIENQTMIYIGTIVIAILTGLFSNSLYSIGIFFLCAMSAYILCGNLNLSGDISTIIGLIIGIIAGILGVKFTRSLIIISTGIGGSTLFTDTLFNILNITPSTLSTIILLIIASLGITYQFKQKA